MTRGESGFHHQVDSIEWYCESRGHGPTVVLIPSGEGDCSSFERVVASLASDFTVLTFDMPGFSRSSDPPDFAAYSLTRAASEVAALVRSLDLGPATFYGCSSGGVVALCLAADHPDLARNVVIHEVPLSPVSESFLQLTLLDDAAITPACQAFFRTQLNEKAEAWDALGDAFHTRLARNYVTWVRRYVEDNHFLRTFTREELRRRPVTWTLGDGPPSRCSSTISRRHTLQGLHWGCCHAGIFRRSASPRNWRRILATWRVDEPLCPPMRQLLILTHTTKCAYLITSGVT